MRVEGGVREARAAVIELRAEGQGLAFVPTMGALHAGHESLVARARARAGRTVLSVFVNPLQFGPGEDYRAYPRDLDRDAELAAGWGVDLLFAPEAGTFTAPGARVTVDPGALGASLEGRARPDHFRGVLTVVAKLLHVVGPDVAVFGQKDLQQAVLVRAMVRDLDFPVAIDVAPTVREPDGLALSSRNAYLSAEERAQAPALYRALRAGEAALGGGERRAQRLRETIRRVLEEAPDLRPDYVAVLRADDLAEVEEVQGPTALAVAARLGRTRLIDNLIVGTGAPRE